MFYTINHIGWIVNKQRKVLVDSSQIKEVQAIYGQDKS